MSHDPLISFQRHLQAQGKRPGTQERYVAILGRFLHAVQVPADRVTSEQMYAYLVERGNALSRSASWYNVIFHALKAWLVMRGLPADLQGLTPKRVYYQPPRWLTKAEAQRLIAALAQRPYRMVFQVMLATGMRISEVLALRPEDIYRDEPLIRVRCGKGGHGRLVRCETTLRTRLRDYWRIYKPKVYLFQRRPGVDDGRPMLVATVNAALTRAARSAGLEHPVSSHWFRHTFAIHSLRGGMDLAMLSKLLGHRSLMSTARYLTPDLVRPGTVVDVLADLEVQP